MEQAGQSDRKRLNDISASLEVPSPEVLEGRDQEALHAIAIVGQNLNGTRMVWDKNNEAA